MMSERMTVVEWLLDSDPAIRWQVMRDLTREPLDVVIAERSRVGIEGWGAALLALQDGDGRWDGGTYRPGWVDDSKPFFDAWTATHFSLQLLRDFGLDADGPEARRALSLVRENVRWEANDALYFEGETEPCINGMALATGAYFGEAVDGIVGRLLGEQLDDGGWNCWAEYGATVSSFHTTICVLEGLLAFEEAFGASPAITEARRRGEEYLSERRLTRRLSTGEMIDETWTRFAFPPLWHYDVLRALDYFRSARASRDERFDEALAIVRERQQRDGRWLLDVRHRDTLYPEYAGEVGQPNRWITLRALRVLNWASASEGARPNDS